MTTTTTTPDTCNCPYNGRRHAHYDWCPRSTRGRAEAAYAARERREATRRAKADIQTVRVTLRFTVSQSGWNAEYGTDDTMTDIADAIRGMVTDAAVAATNHLATHAIKSVD